MGERCDKVGGAELQQTLLASFLVKLGYPVTFLVPDFGQPPTVTAPQGITLLKIRPQSGRMRGLRFLDEVLRFHQAMKRADADIYYQRAASHVTGITALYCRIHRKPFVFSLASNMDLDGTWRRGLKPHYYRLYRYGLTHATVIVPQTDDQVRMLKDIPGAHAVLIRDGVPNGDTPEKSAHPAPPPANRYILWVGNFWAVKRPAMFLELARSRPQYEFVMVGGPHAVEEHIFEETREQAKGVPNLRFVGPVPFLEVGAYFDGAAIFVNTTSVEGFPNTYMQSWSKGIPVVATFDADNLIKRYGLGRHCADVDELGAGLDEFMSDEGLRGSTGERAIEYAREHHSFEAVAAQHDWLFMQLYREEKPGG